MEPANFTREELAQYILHSAKDAFVDKVKAMILDEKVVAYTIDGNPLTASQYRDELSAAENEIENGDYLTSDQLKNEISTWE